MFLPEQNVIEISEKFVFLSLWKFPDIRLYSVFNTVVFPVPFSATNICTSCEKGIVISRSPCSL